MQSKFTQRPGKFTGASFAQTLVLGYLHKPTATLPELASFAADFGTEAKTQALNQRFTAQAADFMKKILEATLQIMVRASALPGPLYSRFSGIYILDSTVIALPAALAADWPLRVIRMGLNPQTTTPFSRTAELG